MSGFNYNPGDAVACWPEGEYDAILESAEVGTSKSSGAPMQTLSFRVYHPDGREAVVKDYIVNPSTLFKLKRFAVAIGQGEDFKAGTFQAADHLQTRLTLALSVQESAEYGDRNQVDGYKPPASAAPNFAAGRRTAALGKSAATPVASEINGDDIPFSPDAPF